MSTPVPVHDLGQMILSPRGQRVILDADLAALYGVPTKVLNQAAKRNADRFPDEFAFQLVPKVGAILRSQIVTSSSHHGGSRKPPYAFTEHGVLMAANVLNNPRASPSGWP